MSTVTLELPDDIATQLSTPEGMARAQAAILAAFTNVDEVAPLTSDEWRLVDEALEQVTQGKLQRHNKAAIMAHSEELLKAAGLS